MRIMWLPAALVLGAGLASAQNATPTRPPIIDVHVHAMMGMPSAQPACANTPAFLASDPKEKEAPFGCEKLIEGLEIDF